MTAIVKRPLWIHKPSPKDGKTYSTLLRNYQGDTWESSALADPKAVNGWRNGKWQDWDNEVKAYREL